MAAKFLKKVRDTVKQAEPIAPPSGVVKTPEIEALASRIAEKHDKRAGEVACAWLLASSLLTHYGTAHGVDVGQVKMLLCEALHAWMDARGLTEVAVRAAYDDLMRAGQTVQYLQGLRE